MPDLLPVLRQRYSYIAKDLLGPLIEVLTTGRRVAGDDLDKVLILLVVAMRTAEHRGVIDVDLEDVMSGAVQTYPSLSTNVRSIAESTGIPKESVRRKVGQLVEEGWIVRQDNSLSYTPEASRRLVEFRDQLLQMAIRNEQTVQAARRSQDG